MVIGLCIYLLQIPVPQLIAQPLELMANMTTPLSMVITGMLFAAGSVVLTTLLSIVALPLCALVVTLL